MEREAENKQEKYQIDPRGMQKSKKEGRDTE